MAPKEAEVERFAEQVRALKERSGRSYGALARRLGVSASTLHRYGSGEAVPSGFAPVERLARLCGASPQEVLRLHRLWILADAARRPRTAAPAAPPPREPAERERTPDPVPAAEPEPEPESVPEPAPAVGPEPTGADAVPGRRASRPRRAVLLAAVVTIVAVAVTAVVTVAVTGSSAPGSPGSGTGGSAASPSGDTAEAPLVWTVDSDVWQSGCDHDYLIDREPEQVPPPPVEQDAGPWARSLGALDGGNTTVRVSLQGTSGRPVVVEALHVRVTERAAPVGWNAYRMSQGCGGALSPRHFDVDLDAPRPVARSVAGFDGMAGERIPAVSFPYTVTATDPEVLLVSARTTDCDCRWYLELEWSGGGRSGTVEITDDGRPFRTSGIGGAPVHQYADAEGRWTVGQG
ncbi:helix-turn-helix domain-containing protein [Streptomyces sp. TRM43335]|uniref:Helix-turn-helix domain-containing protein n=1 Tax=Streptomyces taklimakanensis TaxID=2569853 RepID=A0A6G2BCB7_9ACTN|nr:helix-turn-helix transcriptional regulator [Streptomyces taklimakanensis]MTE19864.1 helix-turn-helix domain-containing protein [Streptomyces taklimakanensis]